jgi:methyl-accepting chemotaxis protein
MSFSESKENKMIDKRQVPSSAKDKVAQNKVVSKPPSAPKVKFGLTAKVITLMLVVSLLPLVIFAGITLRQTDHRIRTDIARLMALTASDIVANVDEWTDKNVRVLRALAKMPDMISMIRERQEPLLKAVAKEYPWTYLVFTIGPDGMNVARNDDNPLLDYADRDYYKEVIGGKDLAWQTLVSKTLKKPALIMAVPIKSADRTVGVIAMGATIEDLSKLVATWKQGGTGYAFLVDEKGKVLSHQVEDYVIQQTNLSEHPLIAAFKKGQKEMIYFSDRGTKKIGHAKETKYGWTLAMQQDTRETFKTLRDAETFTYILLGITALGVILIAWFLGRAIGNPIRKLTEVAERISVGDMGAQIKIRSRDEIGNLAEAVLRMQDSLRLAIERLRHRQ